MAVNVARRAENMYTECDTTDMLIAALANSDKLVPPSQRVPAHVFDVNRSKTETDETTVQDYRSEILPSPPMLPSVGNGTAFKETSDEATQRNYSYPEPKHFELDDDFNNYVKPHSTPIDPRHDHSDPSTNTDGDDREVESLADDGSEKERATWSKSKLKLKKIEMISKLIEMHNMYGTEFTQDYGLRSRYEDMANEYKLHSFILKRRSNITWGSECILNVVKGIELLNDRYDPFNFKFNERWSSNIRGNINEYYEVLGELHDKYMGENGGHIEPEIRLPMMLILSGLAVPCKEIIRDNVDPMLTMALGPYLKTPYVTPEEGYRLFQEKQQQEHEAFQQHMKTMEMVRQAEEEKAKMQRPAFAPLQTALQFSDASEATNQLRLQNARLTEIQNSLDRINLSRVPVADDESASSIRSAASRSSKSRSSTGSRVKMNPGIRHILEESASSDLGRDVSVSNMSTRPRRKVES